MGTSSGWIGVQLSLFDDPQLNCESISNCSKKQSQPHRRMTHAEVEEAFAKEGYELLEKYVSSKKKMSFKCPRGHFHQISWELFRIGARCKFCSHEDNAQNQRFSHEFIEQQLKKERYKLLSIYQSAQTPIIVVCPEGHEYETRWASFNSGVRCKLCRARQQHLNKAETVKAAFAAEGYNLLDEYESHTKKMKFICPQGHQHQISWLDWGRGKRCKFCSRKANTEKRRTSPELVKQTIEAEGYKLLEEYRKNLTPMKCICPKGHETTVRWSHFQRGNRCEICAHEIRGRKRRKTHEEVEAAFEVEGYRLLDRYEGAHKKMRFICPKGHQHEINWTNFSQGYRCAYCSGRSIVTHERVEAAFSKEGYQLLDRYESKKKKLTFICPQGHQHEISWDNFNSGYRCAYCSGRIVTHEQVEQAFEKEGYKLLSEYKRNTTKLKFICPEGHEHSITWADFRSGCRCAYCAGKIVDLEEVKAVFETAGYTLLNSYERADKKLKYICPNGHQHEITWNSFKAGNRCAYCAGKILTHEQVELAFTMEGYQLLDRYVNSNTKMQYICPEGHQHSIIWDAFKQGVRCPYCAGMKPSEEQRKINRIKYGIARLIQIYLRQQVVKKQFSITTFAGKVAKLVFEVLGTRPDGCHLDHVVPQSYFDFRNQEEVEACWHIANLRYLPARENEGRGNRLTLEEVRHFSKEQLQILQKASLKPSRLSKFLDSLSP
jgi:DNA-directed RNA polymerase subunit RPC12/RpoP